MSKNNKSIISALYNLINIIVNLLPIFVIIPIISKKFGNDGVGYWNLYLAFISIYLLISDYGLNEDASRRIKEDVNNLFDITVNKLTMYLAALLIMAVSNSINLNGSVNNFYIAMAVLGYTLNPVYYFQSKKTTIIPLVVNSISLLIYIGIAFLAKYESIDLLMLLFSLRLNLVSMTLWIVIFKNEKFINWIRNFEKNKIIINAKQNFKKFIFSLGFAFINAGYLIIASKQMSAADFGKFSMMHKLAFIGVMIVISYCQTAMLEIKNTRVIKALIYSMACIYLLSSLKTLEIFGVNINYENDKILALACSGLLLFYALFIINYYKIISISLEKLKIINYYNLLVFLCVSFASIIFELPYQIIIGLPVIYAGSVYLISKKILSGLKE